MNRILVALLLFGVGPVIGADGETAAAFSEQMTDATLKGTWVPLQRGSLGSEKPDAYEVARARQIEGDRWEIVWKVKRKGQTVEYPLPCVIQFAGDTTVLILDEAPVGEGKAYSARILFHGNVYTGRWWGMDGEGGLVSGIMESRKAD